MDITGQQLANPSATQPTMTQQTHNRIAQQAQQMQLAGQPMNHVAQQMPIVELQVDWSTKIAEVMREQFGLRQKQ